MTDDTIGTALDQRMSWLNGDQTAKATAEHKRWPDP
jgi:hypothetical protein